MESCWSRVDRLVGQVGWSWTSWSESCRQQQATAPYLWMTPVCRVKEIWGQLLLLLEATFASRNIQFEICELVIIFYILFSICIPFSLPAE